VGMLDNRSERTNAPSPFTRFFFFFFYKKMEKKKRPRMPPGSENFGNLVAIAVKYCCTMASHHNAVKLLSGNSIDYGLYFMKQRSLVCIF
jgi:hypothetical protein